MHNQHDEVSSNSILQWNVNGLNANRDELKQLISQFNPFCIALNESRTDDPKKIIDKSFKNYSLYYNKNEPHLGNLILVRKDISFVPVILNTSLNAIAIEFSKGCHKIRICSIYLSPNIVIHLPDLQSLSEQLSPIHSPCSYLILGDFNARSEYWHDSLNNSRGNKILDYLLHFDLEVLNEDHPTRFNMTHHCQTNIDLSLCTRDLVSELCWQVHSDLCGSDHYPILVHFLNLSLEIPKFTWKYNRANWPFFTYATRDINYDPNENSSTNLQNFMKQILVAAENHIPHSQSISLSTKNPWWNEECKQAKRNRNKARRKYLKTKSLSDLIEFKRLKALSRKTYNIAKKQSWSSYISEINSEVSIK